MQQQQNAHYLQVISSEILYFFTNYCICKKINKSGICLEFLASSCKTFTSNCLLCRFFALFANCSYSTWNSSPDLGELTFILWRAGWYYTRQFECVRRKNSVADPDPSGCELVFLRIRIRIRIRPLFCKENCYKK